jgi:protein-L-isoaspartate(D-aspartate) O-methyltransferase
MKTAIEPTAPNTAGQAPPATTRPRPADVLAKAPRHLFVPSIAWVTDTDQRLHLIDRNAGPDDWWAAVYSGHAIAVHTGERANARSTVLPTSTVLHLLDLLDTREHHLVLEIGTATGWMTALLALLVGDSNLTTLEFDSHTAAAAQANLHGLGLTPRSHVVQTQVGYACTSPLDRILITFGVTDVPYHWIAQCRPGGVIVLPWTPGPGRGHALRLTVIDQAHAVGSFHGSVETVLQPSTWPPTSSTGAATTSRTLIDPRELIHADQGAHLAVAQFAPGIGWHAIRDSSGQVTLGLFETDDPSGSWATCDYQPAAHDFTVTQHGDRSRVQVLLRERQSGEMP